jgi:D-alanine transfer protein
MKYPHLASALAVLVCFAALTVGFDRYAQSVEDRYAHALAPGWIHEKTLSSAIQRACLRQTDLLPVYGSSQLAVGGRDNPAEFFSAYPTGFGICRIAWAAEPLLAISQQLASLGTVMRGEKVVVSIVPSGIYADGEVDANFSVIEANQTIFSDQLSFELKQRLARRMLKFPNTLIKDPLLRLAIEELIAIDTAGRLVYYGLFPLGRLRVSVLCLQDHWEVLSYISNNKDLNPDLPRKASALDWSALIAKARRDWPSQSANTPFGFLGETWWTKHRDQFLKLKDTLPDPTFREIYSNSARWDSVDLILATCRELGASPLLLAVPFNGPFSDYRGDSAAVRKACYYDRLHGLGKKYGIPVVTGEEFEYDQSFFYDLYDHPSPAGWAYYDQVLDAFYHGKLH